MTLSTISKTRLSCATCDRRQSGFICQLSPVGFMDFTLIKHSSFHSAGEVLFLENQSALGLYVLCSGQIKLSFSSIGGKTLTLRIAKPGDLLGLSAILSGGPHEVTAEVLQPAQVAFISRSDFLRFMDAHPEAYSAVISQIGHQYQSACDQLRTVALSTTAREKLARLLLEWASAGMETPTGTQIRVPWTHEQIAERIGSTRETISRTLSQFKTNRLITISGATMTIPSRAALAAAGGV